MCIDILDRYLPIELVDKIYKELHRSLMRDIIETINHKLVFIIVSTNGEDEYLSFLVAENQNYYSVLDDEIVLNQSEY